MLYFYIGEPVVTGGKRKKQSGVTVVFGFKKKKEVWKATFKTLGSAYSYAKVGDTIILQEPDSDLSEIQFQRKLEEAMYKFKVEITQGPSHTEGFWQVELVRA